MLTEEGGQVWVDFTSSGGSHAAEGFQLSLLTVSDNLKHVIEAVKQKDINSELVERIKNKLWGMEGIKRIKPQLWGNQPANIELVSNLLSSLQGRVMSSDQYIPIGSKDPLIEVVDEKEHQNIMPRPPLDIKTSLAG